MELGIVLLCVFVGGKLSFLFYFRSFSDRSDHSFGGQEPSLALWTSSQSNDSAFAFASVEDIQRFVSALTANQPTFDLNLCHGDSSFVGFPRN
jgi:hypothetical protein